MSLLCEDLVEIRGLLRYKNRPCATNTETADTSEDAYIYFTCKNIVSSSDSLRNRNMFSMAVIFIPKYRKEDDFMATAKKLSSGSWRCQVYSHTEEVIQPDGSVKKKRIYKSLTSF